MLTQAQLEQRRSTIGASEIYDVCTRPFRVWRNKHGQPETPSSALQDSFRLGNIFEPALIRSYEADRGIRAVPTAERTKDGVEPVSLINLDRPWQACTPDGVCVAQHDTDLRFIPSLIALRLAAAQGRITHLLEIKTSGEIGTRLLAHEDRWEAGQDCELGLWGEGVQIPRRYLFQVQWMLGLTGLPYCDLRRLHFASEAVRRFVIELTRQDVDVDALLAQLLASKAAEITDYRIPFEPEIYSGALRWGQWFADNHLFRPDNPPPPQTFDDLLELPIPKGEPRQATEEEAELISRLREAIQVERQATMERELLTAEVMRVVGMDGRLASPLGDVSCKTERGKPRLRYPLHWTKEGTK